MRKLFASLVLVMFGVTAYAGDDKPLVVVELYTSEGCSSCPAADKILTKLATRDGILALALHVDYWDYLGWKDQFSIAKFTKRQEYYNMVLGSRYRLVTPQMIFQGQSYVAGARPSKVEKQLAALQGKADIVQLSVEKQTDNYQISINSRGSSTPGADVFIVEYIPNYVAKIEAGENRGKTLTHTNIVTSWTRIGGWSGQKNWSAVHPIDAKIHAAVIVQALEGGPILAARMLQ